jgi:hypothetical protein
MTDLAPDRNVPNGCLIRRGLCDSESLFEKQKHGYWPTPRRRLAFLAYHNPSYLETQRVCLIQKKPLFPLLAVHESVTFAWASCLVKAAVVR